MRTNRHVSIHRAFYRMITGYSAPGCVPFEKEDVIWSTNLLEQIDFSMEEFAQVVKMYYEDDEAISLYDINICEIAIMVLLNHSTIPLYFRIQGKNLFVLKEKEAEFIKFLQRSFGVKEAHLSRAVDAALNRKIFFSADRLVLTLVKEGLSRN